MFLYKISKSKITKIGMWIYPNILMTEKSINISSSFIMSSTTEQINPTKNTQETILDLEVIEQPSIPTKKQVERELAYIKMMKEIESHQHLVSSKHRKSKSKKLNVSEVQKKHNVSHIPYYNVELGLEFGAMEYMDKETGILIDQVCQLLEIEGGSLTIKRAHSIKDLIDIDSLQVCMFMTHFKIIKSKNIVGKRLGDARFDLSTTQFTVKNSGAPINYDHLILRSDERLCLSIYANNKWFKINFSQYPFDEACKIVRPFDNYRMWFEMYATSVIVTGSYKLAIEHLRRRLFTLKGSSSPKWVGENCGGIGLLALALEQIAGVNEDHFKTFPLAHSALAVETTKKEIIHLLDQYHLAIIHRDQFWNLKPNSKETWTYKQFVKHPLLVPVYRYLKLKGAIINQLCDHFRIRREKLVLNLDAVIYQAANFWVDEKGEAALKADFACGCLLDESAWRIHAKKSCLIQCLHGKSYPNANLCRIEGASIEHHQCPIEVEDTSDPQPSTSKEEVVDVLPNFGLGSYLNKKMETWTKAIMENFMLFAQQHFADRCRELMAPLSNALMQIGEFLQPIVAMLEGMKGKAAELINAMLVRLGFPDIDANEVSLGDIATFLTVYYIIAKCENRLLKIVAIAYTVWKFQIIDKCRSVFSTLRDAFQDNTTHEDTADWTDFSYLLDDDVIVMFAKIATFIICGVCGYAATKNCRLSISQMFCEAFRNIHFVGAGILGIYKICDVFEMLIPKVMKFIRIKMGKIEEKSEKEMEEESLQKFRHQLTQFILLIKSLDNDQGIAAVKESKVLQDTIVSLHGTSLSLQSMLQDPKIFNTLDPEIRNQFRDSVRVHKTLYSIVYRVCRYGGFRRTPFHIQIYGAPGHGKTSMIKPLTTKLAELYYQDIPENNLVWAHGQSDYFDGYHGQKIAIMDDVWKINDAVQFTEILTLISNAPTIVPMAHLEDKATHFVSEFIVSTTNVPHPVIKDVLCAEAVYRRRHLLIHAKADPKVVCKNTSKFDHKLYEKAYPEIPFKSARFYSELPHMTFDIVKSVPDNTGDQILLDRPAHYDDDEELPAGLYPPLEDLKFSELVVKIAERRDAMVREESALGIDNNDKIFQQRVKETLEIVDAIVEKSSKRLRFRLYDYFDIGDVDPDSDEWAEYEAEFPETEEERSNYTKSVVEKFKAQVEAAAGDPGLTLDPTTSMGAECTSDGPMSVFEENLRRNEILRKKQKNIVPSAQKIPFGEDTDYPGYMQITNVNFSARPGTSVGYHLLTSPFCLPVTRYMLERWPRLEGRESQLGQLRIEFLTWLEYNETSREWYVKESAIEHITALYGHIDTRITEGVKSRALIGIFPAFIEQCSIFEELTLEQQIFIARYAHYKNIRTDCLKTLSISFSQFFLKVGLRIVDLVYRGLRFFVRILFVVVSLFVISIYVAWIIAMFKFIAKTFSISKEDTSRVYFKRGPNPIHKPVIDTSAPTMMAEQLTEKISKNLLYVTIGDLNMNGIGIDGHYLLVPYHGVRKLIDRGENFRIEVRPTMNSSEMWFLDFEPKNCHIVPDTDAVLMYNRYMPPFSKILHHFIQEKDLEGGIPSDIYMAYMKTGSKGESLLYTHQYTVTQYHTQFLFTSGLLGSAKGAKVLEYRGSSPLGASGGAIYMPSRYNPRSIYGIQSNRAKYNNTASFVAIVTQENIQDGIKALNAENFIHEGPVVLDTSVVHTPTQELITSHIRIVGEVLPQNVVGIVGSTRFEKTIFAEEFPSERIPAILNAFDTRVPEGTHPMTHSVNKYGRDVMVPLDLKRLEFAKRGVTEYLRSIIGPQSLRVLTFREAIEGLEEEGFQSINLKTSPGLPYVLQNPGRGKKHWITMNEDGKLESYDPEIETSFNDIIGSFASGVIPELSMYEFPKDELRPESKALGPPIKTRSITVLNFVLSIVYRRYHLDLEAQLHKAADGLSQFCVGINPSGTAWTTMFHTCSQVGSRGFDFDVGNWDGHFPPELFFGVEDVVSKLYDDGPENHKIRLAIAEQTCFGYDQWLDLVLQKLRGMASGFPGTAFTNTVGHMILFYYFYLENCEKLCLRQHRNFESYLRLMSVRFYGDDVFCVLSDVAIDLGFNPAMFAALYEGHGWPVTSAAKDSGVNQLKPLMDLQFLKRNFVIDPIIGKSLIHAAIDKTVINDVLHWIRRQPDLDAQLSVNITEAMEFSFAHGPIFYEDTRKCINDVLQRNGHRMYLIDYHAMRDIMFARIW